MFGYPRTGLPTVKYATGSWPSSIKSSPESVRTVAYLTPQPPSSSVISALATTASHRVPCAGFIAGSTAVGLAPQPGCAAHAGGIAVQALHEPRAHRLVAHAAGGDPVGQQLGHVAVDALDAREA